MVRYDVVYSVEGRRDEKTRFSGSDIRQAGKGDTGRTYDG